MSLRETKIAKFQLLVWLVLALMGGACPGGILASRAQTLREPAKSQPTKIELVKDDRLRPDDVLAVIVLKHPEMSLDPVMVTANGTIQLPVAGTIMAAGKTTAEVAAAITKALSRQIRNPRVTVVLKQARPRRVFVLGAVTRPGAYDLPLGSGVIEALALAGGALPRAALGQAQVTRPDGSVITVNLRTVPNNPEINRTLEPGGLLLVPESQARITVRGAVVKPGLYDLADDTSVPIMEALALAGGALPRAALGKAQVTYADGSVATVDLFKAASLGQPEADIQLTAGSVLTVPTSAGITVLGAVQRPGILTLEEGNLTLAEALAQAGGLTVLPPQALISISRNGPDGQAQISSIDPVKLLSLRDATQNVPLQDGDIVSVAAKEVQIVFVSGEVKTPGAYELQEGDSVPELIVRAGGPTPLAALTRISVVKREGGAAQTVNIANALIEGGDRPDEFALQQGDFIVVPKNEAAVLVLGAVLRPGRYPIPETEQLTLGEALGLAGGARERAKVKEIAILRQDPAVPGAAGLKRQVVSIASTKDGQLALNQTLLPGTVVYVPEPSQPGALQRALSWISPLTMLFR